MTKKPNHNADIKNPNTGTTGTNKSYDKNQGNTGKQLNPNQTPKPVIKNTSPRTGVSTIQRDFDKRGEPYPDWLKIRQSELDSSLSAK